VHYEHSFSSEKWPSINGAISVKNKKVISSSWDGRPFGHNRHGPKSRALLCPFWGDRRRSEAEAIAGA